MNGSEMGFIKTAFENNWIAPFGPNLTGFEEDVCSYLGIKKGIALVSGTSAIHLALRYLGIGKEDIVFCSDLTFSGSCNPVLYQDAKLAFIDAEYKSLNMSPKALKKALVTAAQNKHLPKAVIVVDIFGQSADYDALLPICEEYGVPVIEDAAEALGAEYKGKKCGSFGDIGVLSFNGNKIITTSGGGMAVSNNVSAIKKISFWASQSKEDVGYYLHKELGFNYRMSNISAGIGRGQMKTLDERVAKRKNIYEQYREALAGLPVKIQPALEGCKPNYWLSILTIDKECNIKPDNIIACLEADNIEARRTWYPMHCQPFFDGLEYYIEGENSVSEDIFNRGICLPSGSAMTPEDLERVCKALSEAFGG